MRLSPAALRTEASRIIASPVINVTTSSVPKDQGVWVGYRASSVHEKRIVVVVVTIWQKAVDFPSYCGHCHEEDVPDDSGLAAKLGDSR